MKNQVLSIEQMQELVDMGINTSNASMCWVESAYSGDFVIPNNENIIKVISNNYCFKNPGVIPTFTLQNILEITIGTTPQLWRKDGIPTWHIHNYMMKGHFIGINLMDIAFKYIKWCKQNNYI